VTSCARCGDCCDPVKIDFDVWARAVATARRHGPDDVDPLSTEYWANCLFLAADCRPVGALNGQVLLACAHYDREHQACRAYGRRPPVCSGFPWYGREPGDGGAEPRCSYWLDVAPADRPEGYRPLIPLMAIRG
jgi:Fe-S-cluster containining protein